MAHKAMIGGTVYEIGGGKAMVGGAVYDIEKGKTMVSGTVREIAFAEMITVTITGYGAAGKLYIVIDGTEYRSGTIDIEKGTVITVFVGGTNEGTKGGTIVLNGKTVATATTKGVTYDLATDNYTAVTIAMTRSLSEGTYKATITTE